MIDAVSIPRGVRPAILLEQIRNTVPFAFGDTSTPYISTVNEVFLDDPTHAEYFRLCLSAHYTTVGSFVPTDVDNQIRYRLWHPAVPVETLEEMAELVLSAIRWDPRPVSTRWVMNQMDRARPLSGHDGEWFSVAVAAYAALRRKSPEISARVLGAIEDEIERETNMVAEFGRKEDGIGLLKASTLIAHNLGDLARVIEMWHLAEADPLVKLSACESDWLRIAGKLNKLFMAEENHRHFSLRGPKGIRKFADLLLPIGPFFDEWGVRVARHPGLTLADIVEVMTSLIDGWVWLAEKRGEKNAVTVGYARALAGISEGFPGGISGMQGELPSSLARRLKSGPLCNLLSVDRSVFEGQWRKKALNAAFKPALVSRCS